MFDISWIWVQEGMFSIEGNILLDLRMKKSNIMNYLNQFIRGKSLFQAWKWGQFRYDLLLVFRCYLECLCLSKIESLKLKHNKTFLLLIFMLSILDQVEIKTWKISYFIFKKVCQVPDNTGQSHHTSHQKLPCTYQPSGTWSFFGLSQWLTENLSFIPVSLWVCLSVVWLHLQVATI